MVKRKLVVVGNGMAGVRCVENILREGPDAFDITIFGREPHGNYSRIMLSSVLQGSTSFKEIMLNPYIWYEENGITLYTGEMVTQIDKENKCVETDLGREVEFDKLIMATGSSPFVLPLAGVEKEGVISFRTIEDCQRMIETADHYKKAVVIGGGLLGLEAARGLLNLGMEVDVVHRSEYIMQRQLDEQASLMLQKELESQGMRFLLNIVSHEVLGEERVEGLRFDDGTEVETDLVVMAVGIKPNSQLAKDSGVETNRGILVNDFLETNTPDLYAIGECAEHEGIVYGLVQPLYEQGEVLARHLCGKKVSGYRGSVLSTQLKISGVDVFSVGQFTPDRTTEGIHYQNDIEGVYKKVVFRGNKAVGAVLFGDTRLGPKLLDTIVKEKVVSDQDKASLLDSLDPGNSPMAKLPLTDNVCTCNGVSKESIIAAVQQENLKTVDEVKTCTKASSSCGGCKPSVAELLDYISSDHFNEEVKDESLCACTSLSEDEVVEQIQLKELATREGIMDELEWNTEKGCSDCRPALNYYLQMIHPWFENNEEALYLNEKMNAALQSDGTYVVTPQIHGGIPNIEQLNKMTYVANKYSSIELAISRSQRIHFLGVKKKDLSRVWADLDMPLVVPGVNKVSPIQTSIGEDQCPCTKQYPFDLIRSLEQRTELLQTPYRLNIEISLCFHNGAEATTKDIGSIKVSGGWEIYVGGSSAKNVREGQLLCVVHSDEEALQFMAGFIQYYRESARYRERTWQWLDRVGLVHVREVLFNEEIRGDFLERMNVDSTQRNDTLVNM
ncbi:nitrite reductase large subunit NirB [Halobacillus sp. H74]|uniref:nitrite reductase large subunit NirB n=1 Tax=Halobacillus sp. H74 TaxID=3457436 RepID=UPI003FCE3E52